MVSTMILLNFQPRTRGSLKISEFLKSVELSHTVAVNATTLESKTSRGISYSSGRLSMAIYWYLESVCN